jgi:hypothetical protein
MPVGSTPHLSVQVPGFDELGHLNPDASPHIRFLFVRPALCHPASFRLAVAREILAFG